jgi:hypothetical protein
MTKAAPRSERLDELRKRKDVFDNTWTLAIVLSASSIIVFWYLGLGQVDIAPIIWTLAALAVVQFVLNARTARCATAADLRRLAQISEVVGIVAMAVAWHLFGGLQQPMFPLFIMLPLFTGALILNFWQQQSTIILFLGVLLSGVLLSPDTNSFIEERYGLSALSTHVLPAWIPRSRVAFLDVSTSPTYNLMLTGSLAILAVALTATARAIVALSWRSVDSLEALRDEVEQARQLGALLVEKAPASEVLIALYGVVRRQRTGCRSVSPRHGAVCVPHCHQAPDRCRWRGNPRCDGAGPGGRPPGARRGHWRRHADGAPVHRAL